MKTVSVEIPEDLYHEFVQLGKSMDRDPDGLIRAALEIYRQQHGPWNSAHSVMDIKPAGSFGKILKPWKSRGEMLEDFFDRSE